MAVQHIDIKSDTSRDSVSLTASGTVTNTVRVAYDDTKEKAEILVAIDRAKEIINELID